MTDNRATHAFAELVEAAGFSTIDELCLACDVDARWIAQLVAFGVIEPIGPEKSDWRFSSLSIVRVARAKRMRRDLELDPAGIAVALQLLDEIETLRRQLRTRSAETMSDPEDG